MITSPRVSSRIVAIVLGAMATASLAACSGDPLLAVGNASIETAAAPASGNTASAYGGAQAETNDATTGPREVIASPTVGDIMQTGTLPEMSWGKADAPVVVVKYMSLTCPYCRKFHQEVYPELDKRYIKTGKVRFILREFPIGRTSGNATIALRCAPPAKYLELYGKFLDQQATWVSQEVRPDAIFAVAKQVGMKREQFDACLQDKALLDGLKWVKDRGRTLGIIGTPNFFVDGKLVKKVLSAPELFALVDAALAGPAAQLNAAPTR
ncbi:MAG: DsbA family protein [Hyphomicrobiaceae bacterium]